MLCCDSVCVQMFAAIKGKHTLCIVFALVKRNGKIQLWMCNYASIWYFVAIGDVVLKFVYWFLGRQSIHVFLWSWRDWSHKRTWICCDFKKFNKYNLELYIRSWWPLAFPLKDFINFGKCHKCRQHVFQVVFA